MTRFARVAVPEGPHRVTQRGSGGGCVFVSSGVYALYRDWLGESRRQFGVELWTCRRMPNPVRLVLTPSDGDGLA